MSSTQRKNINEDEAWRWVRLSLGLQEGESGCYWTGALGTSRQGRAGYQQTGGALGMSGQVRWI